TNTLTINNIDLIDKGAYTCKVTGTCSYVNSTPANLTVDPTTAIITQPVDFYAVTSGNATFSVTASGASAYQWQKDGVNLSDGGVYSGVNKPILSLTNVTSANAGSYRCIVTGNCGTVNSNPGYLTVNLTNLITTQPAGPVVKCAGESANFDVVAQGTNITYQWRKDGVVLSDNTQITGSKTADLSIKNVVESNSGNYSCLVTADEGTQTSMPASLTVNALTDVTLQPLDAVKCVGDQAVFTIQAKGSNLTYQWIKRVNGTDTNLSDGGTISGATTAELTISKVVTGDAGVYICHVSGDCGNDNSNSATLTVNQNTKINTQPVSQSKCSGTTVTFAVSADGSNLKYQWKKNGTAITDGTNIAGATTATLTLSNLALADAGPYTCDVTGSCSQETSSPAILSVTQSPAVTIQPQPVVKCEGDHVVFAVTTTGAKSHQWTKDNVALSDNTNISGSTTDILSIAAATASDAGSYQCTVTGNSSCGVALSDAATLTINQQAKILTDPVGAAKCEGSSVTFSVTASGTSLNYQWKKDGADLSDGTNISGTKTKDLNLTNLAQSDAGTYSCVVTGPCTSVTSAMATLKVNPATKIFIQPLSKEVVIGQSASFAINATGTNLKYQWEKDGASLSDGSTIQGTLTNKLTLTSTASADAGSYRCVVTGDCGIVDSDPATLSVDLNTAITSQPSGITLCQGNAVVLSLTANGTSLTFQWKKDGTALTDVSGIISGSTGPTLTIQHAQTSDAGAYTCVVTGAGGLVTSDVAQVVVNPSASVSTQPISVTVCKGTDASFVISATGASTYQWYKDGTLLSDGGTVSGSQTNYLYLHNVTDADAGTYYCKATGSCTTATSNTATLTVNDPVEITTQPVTSQSRCEGDKAIFSFGVTGTNVTYQWKKDGSALGNGGRISGANTANLTISGLTAADAGNYICVVSGSCGNVINSDPSTLLVNEPVVITDQPVSQSACVGDNKYFGVTATGSNLQYQWKKNGININGATSNQLVLSSVVASDAGTYSCLISNSCGDISTDAVQLTVNTSTVITSSPANAVKCLGENASFKVASTGSNLTYQWLFNGNNLTDGGTVSGASTDNLFISSVSASNAGNYSCLVSGSCGTE
ncbi:MAG: immunoglobulin domain-containing protein, partial [Bacteroidota bacterium]|nr:immunoglobulin domain-containing protein [Bacteroidota bacterium]